MYWTGRDPFTLEKVVVIHDYGTKKKMKRMVLQEIEGKQAHRNPKRRR